MVTTNLKTPLPQSLFCAVRQHTGRGRDDRRNARSVQFGPARVRNLPMRFAGGGAAAPIVRGVIYGMDAT